MDSRAAPEENKGLLFKLVCWEQPKLSQAWRNPGMEGAKEVGCIWLRKSLALCSGQGGAQEGFRAVVLNLPDIATFYYSSSCWGDPPNHRIILLLLYNFIILLLL